MKLPAHTPTHDLHWISARQKAGLTKLGISTLGELIANYPRRHEDRKRFDLFPEEEMESPLCLCGTVVKTTIRRYGRGKSIFDVLLEDTKAGVLLPTLTCRWFHAHYVTKMISTGQRMVLFGRPRKRQKSIVIEHPEFEIIDEEDTSIHFDRLVPVHPAGEGVPARIMRTLIHRALQEVDPHTLESLLPESDSPYSHFQALSKLHFPESLEELKQVKRQLALEEFFALQLIIQSRRQRIMDHQGMSRKSEGKLLPQLLNNLPFAPTKAQQRAMKVIRSDLQQSRPMHRLLQGDVGSGKTLVALAAMVDAVESGCQAALMAPTQLLAEQHYQNFKKLLAPLNLSIAIQTSGKQESASLELWTRDSEPQIIIGTHALLYGSGRFSNLGLVVIDEQHKFGVQQRARLLEQGNTPDLLVMTATPIPRTLALTIYGDLDVSVLDEMPSGRGKIITGIRDQSKIPEAATFLKSQLAEGRQGYIVYPLIEESEKLSSRAAKSEFAKWRTLLAPYQCELLHGKTSPEEKESIMKRFQNQDTHVLVATTVIEVGIDVPNASVMLIENAERFGLAQLHQLRGRIGRGTHKSYCVLMPGKDALDAKEKLEVLEHTMDGFEIAEADLRLRGAGDMIGTAQSGLPPIRLGNLFLDTDLMEKALNMAQELLKIDPLLAQSPHAACRRYLQSHEDQLSRSG